MGLIRLLLLAMVAWLVWRLYTAWQRKQTARAERQRLDRERVVKCAYCSVHVPEGQAITHEALHFCNTGHRERFLQRQDSEPES